MTATEQSSRGPGEPRPDGLAFIETQFPVSKLSKESYKERKAGPGQTLPGLGKWWGRKPLVLVRAAILGLLLPATNDPAGDRDTFLALMTMDNDGMLLRLKGTLPARVVYAHCTPRERAETFEVAGGKPKWREGLTLEERAHLQRIAFLRMGYDERLQHTLRPEEIDGPSRDAWAKINAHLGTRATSLPELVRELGDRRFGHTPRVADAFCGGGSVPFEAARIGCEAYGSDLSPVAALLTWGALNIVGRGDQIVHRVAQAQRRVLDHVRCQIGEWGLEQNDQGWVADAYLYCNDVVDPATGWRVPLAGAWVAAQRDAQVVARLRPDPAHKRFEIDIIEGVSRAEIDDAKNEGTWAKGVRCPVDASGKWLPVTSRTTTSLAQLRGRGGLRRWDASDIVPRPDDVFQERLFCIRWVDPTTGKRCYRAPTQADIERELQVLVILRERLAEWQSKGFIPSARIESGLDNSRPTNARGWTHWHHLFNPRQLLTAGLLGDATQPLATELHELVGNLLAIGRYVDWNSRLNSWHHTRDQMRNVFYTAALHSPPVNFNYRPVQLLHQTVCMELPSRDVVGAHHVDLGDARQIAYSADIWITDPGYADAVPYDELSEFFLSWYDKRLPALFQGWYTDSKRALAVRGRGEGFNRAMVECYHHFAELMPDNGLQVVMFTHQDAEVWAGLALILWAAGLQVSAAWTVATETESAGIKQGNFVQGTVLLVLRKRRGERRGDLSDIFPEVQDEVRRQLDSMLALDPKEDPNFGDADYQLAAYAAALRVLTGYSAVEQIDVERELYRPRARGEKSPITQLIERAVRIASDFLVPGGLDRTVWRRLSPEERLYLKGVEVEAHGEYREGVYQEFARGFGVGEYRSLLGSSAANETRIKTPSEFQSRDLRSQGFAGSLLRQVLFALHVTAREQDPRPAREYLRQEVTNYWDQRQTILALLRYLAHKPSSAMTAWATDVEAAHLLLGSVENDSV